jgi:A/G-specific adenine glycosylase
VNVLPQLRLQNAQNFRSGLLGWYRRNGRDLPWRRTRNPYRILVSEFMLQQTQVGTVLPYYKEWLRRFPNFAALARASQSDVLHAWQGLGYYARARNLHAAAKEVIKRHGARFPTALEKIEELPGIGKYTARAIACFALDQSLPIVEANTARVLTRLFNFRGAIDSAAGQQTLWNYAARLVPKRNAAIYNSALLDLGALVCLPRNPKCGVCPVKVFCSAKNPESLPIKRARPAVKELVEKHTLTIRRGKVLLEKANRRWRGMWILPSANGDSKASGAIYRAVFPFTNHRIALQVYSAHPHKIDIGGQRWFSKSEIASIPIPSPHRRAIEQLLPSA